jgi:hypothetical protein
LEGNTTAAKKEGMGLGTLVIAITKATHSHGHSIVCKLNTKLYKMAALLPIPYYYNITIITILLIMPVAKSVILLKN